MIQDEITSHMRIMPLPANRKLCAVLSALTFGLILFITNCFGETLTEANTKASDASTVSAIQDEGATSDTIRPFRVNIPKEALVDLHRRLTATQWPEKETASDRLQGVQQVAMKELVSYWQTDYDWRKSEGRLRSFVFSRKTARRRVEGR